jgi:hypothetical protein
LGRVVRIGAHADGPSRQRDRYSRDIDLFVPDPQYLGHVTPRLSDSAENLEYVEAAEYVKLLSPTGEIDIVVGAPLTDQPWEVVAHGGRRKIQQASVRGMPAPCGNPHRRRDGALNPIMQG